MAKNKLVKCCIDGVCYCFTGDGCTMAPDFDFKPCCDEHDVCYRFQDRRFLVAVWDKIKGDVKLGYCIATTIKPGLHTVPRRIAYHSAHLAIGVVFTAAVSTLGWIAWGRNRRIMKR